MNSRPGRSRTTYQKENQNSHFACNLYPSAQKEQSSTAAEEIQNGAAVAFAHHFYLQENYYQHPVRFTLNFPRNGTNTADITASGFAQSNRNFPHIILEPFF
ncbi:unnamed protein product [Amoebophrya sp. A120]|nr:unnamed protein product [Amoebophrya sp. A120]|eukprot:GSA120T00024858001.1